MKTKLKDVLYLYIGCEMITGNRRYILDGFLLESSINTNSKPILRLTSDITKEEEKYFSKLFFDLKEKENIGCTSIYIYAKMTEEYLKKGFDLFKLIESGQAIDKTKLDV